MSVFTLERSGEVAELTRLLRESDHATVRRRAAEALGSFPGAEEAVHTSLIESVHSDPNEAVRTAAVEAIDQIGERAIDRLLSRLGGAPLDEESDELSVRTLVANLSSELPEIRMVAANSLGRTGDLVALEPLLDRLKDGDPRVRSRAALACGRLGDPRAVPELAVLTNDRAASVRVASAQALGDIGGHAACEALVPLLDDDSQAVRHMTVTALGESDSPALVEPLASSVLDPSDQVRRAAVYSVVQLLAAAETEASHEIRETVVTNFEAAEDRHIVRYLVDILDASTEVNHRRNAAWLLGRISRDKPALRTIDVLVAALGDDDQTVSQAAATSLTAIGGSRVESALLGALTDAASIEVQALIVFVLGKVGAEGARNRLETLSESTDDDLLRRRAFSALAKLGGR